ncbi:MAG: thioredoxin fold domain-containing protein [Firmicutes bacterium]|nr:thioredoxin fold domain-containing protein [Bacillota bacterium]
MNKSMIPKIVIIVAVITLAAIIIFPKMNGSSVEPQQSGSSTGLNQTGTGTTAAQSMSPGETALRAALKNGKPTMICFHSDSCAPCIEMSEIIAQVKPQYETTINFIDILTGDPAEQSLINKFGVNTIPYTVFFDKTGEAVGQQVGVIEKEQLSSILSDLEK